jgi:hypothetical protein
MPWSAVPATLRSEAERFLGRRVLRAVTQPGGSSPGVTARLVLSNGHRAFVKAVSDTNPESLDMHRAEAHIAAALPVSVPAARLLASLDRDGWVILIFEDVEGWMPVQPWQPAELSRMLDAIAGLAMRLTPSPVEAPSAARGSGSTWATAGSNLGPPAGPATTWPTWIHGRVPLCTTLPGSRQAGPRQPKAPPSRTAT